MHVITNGRNIYVEAYRQIFWFLSFRREFSRALEIRRICKGKRGFALESRSCGFPNKSLLFCTFSNCY